MFKIIDYFVAGNAYGTYSNLVIMFMFMSVMVIISVTLLAKTWILLRKTSNDANKYLLRTMLGILLLNLGEWSLTVTELITGQKSDMQVPPGKNMKFRKKNKQLHRKHHG